MGSWWGGGGWGVLSCYCSRDSPSHSSPPPSEPIITGLAAKIAEHQANQGSWDMSPREVPWRCSAGLAGHFRGQSTHRPSLLYLICRSTIRKRTSTPLPLSVTVCVSLQRSQHICPRVPQLPRQLCYSIALLRFSLSHMFALKSDVMHFLIHPSSAGDRTDCLRFLQRCVGGKSWIHG